MCVVTPKGMGPLAPPAGEREGAALGERHGHVAAEVCVTGVGGGKSDPPPGVGPSQAPIYEPLGSHRPKSCPQPCMETHRASYPPL